MGYPPWAPQPLGSEPPCAWIPACTGCVWLTRPQTRGLPRAWTGPKWSRKGQGWGAAQEAKPLHKSPGGGQKLTEPRCSCCHPGGGPPPHLFQSQQALILKLSTLGVKLPPAPHRLTATCTVSPFLPSVQWILTEQVCHRTGPVHLLPQPPLRGAELRATATRRALGHREAPGQGQSQAHLCALAALPAHLL